MGVTFFDLRRTGNLNLFFFFFPTSADHGYRGKLSQAYHTPHIRLVTKELLTHQPSHFPSPAYAPGATHLIHVPRKNVKPRLIFRNRPLKSSLSIIVFTQGNRFDPDVPIFYIRKCSILFKVKVSNENPKLVRSQTSQVCCFIPRICAHRGGVPSWCQIYLWFLSFFVQSPHMRPCGISQYICGTPLTPILLNL